MLQSRIKSVNMPRAYYNEIDRYAAQWLKNLIAGGHITPGDVDNRSIEEVTPGDLQGYTQCHFFAGIGVWSYALRRAGWPDSRSIWTGSCPCQPFSAAGKGSGFDDQRHLWPAWFWLIQQCRPATIVGEQVASHNADAWLNLVCADLEGLDFAFGAVAFPSAGVGAPHIRDRCYWVGDTDHARLERHAGNGGATRGQRTTGPAAAPSVLDRMANTNNTERRAVGTGGNDCDGAHAGWPQGASNAQGSSDIRGVADITGSGRGKECADAARLIIGDSTQGEPAGFGPGGSNYRPGPLNGFWANADWLGCRDGKWRLVEPGTFPLAHGAPGRVGRLRAYGNAINAEASRIFIESIM